MTGRVCLLLMLIVAPFSLYGENGTVFTSMTEEGIEMTFTVTDEDLHTCRVGGNPDSQQQAIDAAYDGAVTIPSEVEGYAVTEIAERAFWGCEMTDVTIPASVEIMGEEAFACDGLNTVTFLGTEPIDITESVFPFRTDATLYVPYGYADLFLSAPFWADFANIQETILQPEAFAVISEDGGRLTFYYNTSRLDFDADHTFQISDSETAPLWLEFASSVTAVVFDASFADARPVSTYQWFNGMENLSFVSGMEHLNTSEVKYMSYMFQSCKSLRNVELRYMNTAKVEKMGYMFNNCKSLKNVDMSNFDTSTTTSFYRMFNGCSSLESIVLGQLDTQQIEYFSYMFSGCSSLAELDLSDFFFDEKSRSIGMMNGCSALTTLYISSSAARLDNSACLGVGTATNPCALIAPEGFDFGVDVSGGNFVWKRGYFFVERPTAYAELDMGVLTFYYDNLRKMRGNQTYNVNGWDDYCITNTRSVVFDKSFADYRPVSTSRWFQGMQALASIVDIENLNTSRVTDMDDMFYDCATLTSLDLSHFDTSQVGGVSVSFFDESSGGEDDMTLYTEYLCDGYGMKGMFHGCTSLVSLDLSHFDTSNVRNMADMFSDCLSLQSLDIAGFNTSSVIDMTSMFSGCENLVQLNLGHFDISSVGKHPLGDKEEDYTEVIAHDQEGDGTFYEYRTYNFIEGTTENMLHDCYALAVLRVSPSMTWLNVNACSHVGTESEPCTIYAPENFDFEGLDLTAEWFEWKSGFFHLGTEKSVLYVDDVRITRGETVDVLLCLNNGINEYNAYQFDITLPEGITLDYKDRSFVYELSDRYDKEGGTLIINELTEGTYRVAFYSLNNVMITGGDGPVLSLRLRASKSLEAGEYECRVDNIVFNGLGNVSDDIDAFSFTVVSNGYGMGDVDHNGLVNITDVMMTVNYVVGKTPSTFFVENADLNGDQVINISDVMSIVGLVVWGNAKAVPAYWRESFTDRMSLSESGHKVFVSLDNKESYSALQMDVRLPRGASLRGVRMCPERSQGHQVSSHRIGDGEYRILVYAMDGADLLNNGERLVQLMLEGCDVNDVSIHHILCTNQAYENVTLADVEASPTKVIYTWKEEDAGPVYNMAGVPVKDPTKGVYVKNGRKMVVR